MTETESYRAEGHVALNELFPSAVLLAFYEQMRRDLSSSQGSLDVFRTTGPLISKEAIEVYSMQYLPMETFLWGLTPRIAAATDRRLLPTYAYMRMYQQGDICRIHSDRPACEHSVSLTLVYGDDEPWPLSVSRQPLSEPSPIVSDDFGQEAYGSVAMKPGDAVLYQGTHHRHGRLKPNPNSWSAHLFLHWVEADGQYAEHAFDRPARESAAAQSMAGGTRQN